LRLEPDLREAVLPAEVAVVPLLGAHQRVGADDGPGHPEAQLISSRPGMMGAIEAERGGTPRAVVEAVVADRLLGPGPRQAERRGGIGLPTVGRAEEGDRRPGPRRGLLDYERSVIQPLLAVEPEANPSDIDPRPRVDRQSILVGRLPAAIEEVV